MAVRSTRPWTAEPPPGHGFATAVVVGWWAYATATGVIRNPAQRHARRADRRNHGAHRVVDHGGGPPRVGPGVDGGHHPSGGLVPRGVLGDGAGAQVVVSVQSGASRLQ